MLNSLAKLTLYMLSNRLVAICIEYDGTEYRGWQRQPNQISIQGVLETAVEKVFGVRTSVVGAGRTDSGVHAAGQVAHFYVAGGNVIPENRVIQSLNSQLPWNVRVLKARTMQDNFHARFDAKSRTYLYRISTNPTVFSRRFTWFAPLPWDVERLCRCAAVFLGEFDFTTYSKLNPSTPSYVCNVSECCAKLDADILTLRITADRFAYGMVRSIVGALYDVARGRFTETEVHDNLKRKDRSLARTFAPAYGLTLHTIKYSKDPFHDA